MASTLGYPIFDTPAEHDISNRIYECTGPSAHGKAKYTAEGMVVLKGSVTRKTMTNTAGKWLEAKQSNLVREGVLAEHSHDSYVFTQDHIFASPSTAAGIVLARRANGWREWVHKNKTLSENERSSIR